MSDFNLCVSSTMLRSVRTAQYMLSTTTLFEEQGNLEWQQRSGDAQLKTLATSQQWAEDASSDRVIVIGGNATGYGSGEEGAVSDP